MVPQRHLIVAMMLVTGLSSACSIERAQQASQARSVMIGMPKERLLSCMGAPVHSVSAGNTEVWTYYSSNGQTDTSGSATAFGNNFAFGSATSTTRSCKTDVVMSAGRVVRVNYSGN